MSSPPVWSIGTSKRDIGTKTDLYSSPGPGSYTYDNLKRTKTPSWRIGTAGRSKDKTNETPGPGSYETPSKIKKRWPSYGFAGKTALNERDSTPGPGSYHLRPSNGSQAPGPSYSMRLKSNASFSRNESPGPGAYDQNSELLNNRHATYKIGSAKRENLHSALENPGPGHYFANLNGSLSSNGLKHRFGTAGRSFIDSASRTLPGPGSYNLLNRTFESSSKGVSILSKRRESDLVEASRLPGPGAYDPSLLLKQRAPSYRIGSAPRAQLVKDQVIGPGPGNYDPNQFRRSLKAKIGTSLRKSLANRAETPGPGSYELSSSMNNGPTHVIIPKRDDVSQKQKDRDTPGPGTYEPSVDYIKNKKPHFGIGTAKRDPNASFEGGPGPGSYNLLKSDDGPKYRFGSELRGSSLNQSPEPGPGSYDIPTKFNDVPSYALAGMSMKNSFH